MPSQRRSAFGDSPLGMIGVRPLETGNKHSKGEGKGTRGLIQGGGLEIRISILLHLGWLQSCW